MANKPSMSFEDWKKEQESDRQAMLNEKKIPTIKEQKEAGDKADKKWYDQYMYGQKDKAAQARSDYQRKQAEEAGGYGDTKKPSPKPAAKPKPKPKAKAAPKKKPESPNLGKGVLGKLREKPEKEPGDVKMAEGESPRLATKKPRVGLDTRRERASESQPAKKRGKVSRFVRAVGRDIGAAGRGVGRGARWLAKGGEKPSVRKSSQGKTYQV